MNILAIIPARGGSKGVPGKNLKKINDISLVGWSAIHAKESKLITRTIISSDSEAIIAEAVKHGAEAPFIRPAELAGDLVLDWPVFVHALDYLKNSENYIPDFVVHLRPTAPLRKQGWIDSAIQLLIDHPEADSVRSVSMPDKHPYRIFRIAADGYLDPIMKAEHPTPYLLRRQDLPPMYYYNCVIDVTKPSTLYQKQSMTGDKLLPYIMNPDEVIDIDAPRDLEIASLMMRQK
jgi:CMP-N,N'-diacetyllegionaminic acid synthase